MKIRCSPSLMMKDVIPGPDRWQVHANAEAAKQINFLFARGLPGGKGWQAELYSRIALHH